MQVECLLNPGVFRFDDKTWLLLRVAERPEQEPGKTSFPVLDAAGEMEILEFDNSDPKLNRDDPRVINYDGKDFLTTMSHLRLVASDDGIHFREDPSYPADVRPGRIGIVRHRRLPRDADRRDLLPDLYASLASTAWAWVCGRTTDWRNIRQHGMILPPHNKDCAIFGEQIGGKYYALHRPSSPSLGGNYIWLAESPDLVHWGGHRCLAHSRSGMWDAARVGAGAAPIRTPAGLAGNLSRRRRQAPLLPRSAAVGSGISLESPRPLARTDHGARRRLRTHRFLRQRRLHQRPRRRRRHADALLRRLRQRDLRGPLLDRGDSPKLSAELLHEQIPARIPALPLLSARDADPAADESDLRLRPAGDRRVRGGLRHAQFAGRKNGRALPTGRLHRHSVHVPDQRLPAATRQHQAALFGGHAAQRDFDGRDDVARQARA